MSDRNVAVSKSHLARVLQRCGLPPELAAEMLVLLPDPVDIEAALPVFERFGVGLDHLEDLLGGSP